MAESVRRQLSLALAVPVASVSLPSLWLLLPPAAPAAGWQVDINVWRLACLAALEAMSFGRRYLWARRHGPGWPDPGPLGVATVRRALPPYVASSFVLPHILAARDVEVATVAAAAANRFWHNLQDFVDDNCAEAPPGWQLPAGHPFLHVVNGVLGVHVPAG